MFFRILRHKSALKNGWNLKNEKLAKRDRRAKSQITHAKLWHFFNLSSLEDIYQNKNKSARLLLIEKLTMWYETSD